MKNYNIKSLIARFFIMKPVMVAIFVAGFCPLIVFAQLNVIDLNSGNVSPQSIVDELIGTSSNASVSNITFVGDSRCIGAFLGGSGLGSGVLGFDSGIILGTGQVVDVVGPNSSDDTTTEFFMPGDTFLDSLVPGFQTYDACVMEFDFECQNASTVRIDYVMGSDEYNEFVGEGSNDVFGFVLNGNNISTIPSSSGLAVSIGNLNCGNPYNPASPVSPNPPFCDFFINNDPQDSSASINIEADGLTTVLTAQGTLNSGVNHMKFAVADVIDEAFDTWVFLKSESFHCDIDTPPVPATPKIVLLSVKNKAYYGSEYFYDEDIIQVNLDGSSTRYFDGSDVGLADTGVDAFFKSASGDLFMSVTNKLDVPGIGLVKNEDIIRFTPSSLGAATQGAFKTFFNGSALGLIDDHTTDQNIDALYIDEGVSSGPLNDDDNDGILNVGDVCPLDAQNDADNDGICGNTLIYISLGATTTVRGLPVANEDIILYTEATDSYSIYFDGSDVGLASGDIDALRLMEDGSLLLSLNAYITLGDVGTVADHDILQFAPTSLGEVTAGSFTLFLDGYSTNIKEYDESQDFDFGAVELISPPKPKPLVLLSTNNKAYYGSEYFYDEDIIQLNTDGSSTRYFDGSDVGLADTGVDALFKSASGDLFLSVTNKIVLDDFGKLKNEDIVRFTPTSLGAGTSGTFTRFFDGSELGLVDDDHDRNIDAVYIDEGVVSDADNDDDNDGVTNGEDACPLDAQNDADNDGICGNTVIYISLSADTSVRGLAVANEDVIRYTEATDSYSKYFDGSDVGLGSNDVDAIHLLDDGRILLSLASYMELNGVGTVADHDVLRFTPTSLGINTTGSFEKIIDGYQIGITEYVEAEDYDFGAIGLFAQ